jgi:sigma-E factor negative regulatory protein RseA
MNEELDSQLSAMFDDELPPAECELLARRLSRDEQLKARWGRYAMIGAAVRAERGVRLDPGLARRVSGAISSEPALVEWRGTTPPRRLVSTWWQPVTSVAMAAGVATAAILWMRSQGPLEIVANAPPLQQPVNLAQASSSASSPSTSYTVPPAGERRVVVPGTEMVNYLVLHSDVSSPFALSGLVAGDAGTAGLPGVSDEPVPPEELQDDAKYAQ